MPDYVNRNYISGTSQLLRSTRYQEGKKTGKERKEKKRKMKNETKTNIRSGSRPSPEGTRLLFADGTVSPMMCPADEQQKDDERPDGGQAKMRAETKPKKTRADHNEVVGFR